MKTLRVLFFKGAYFVSKVINSCPIVCHVLDWSMTFLYPFYHPGKYINL